MGDTDSRSGKKLIEAADEAVAAHLRAERARADLTQTELAQRAGLHAITVHRLENELRPMSLPQLFAICKALGIAPGDFLNAAQANIRE
jgi:transcriptional regulator with XRE-family HTH domain